MKMLVRIFLPICICSFVAFGISVAVLGETYVPNEDYESVNVTDTVITEEYSKIDIGSASSNVYIYPNPDAAGETMVTIDGEIADRVSVKVSGDTLKVREHSVFALAGYFNWDWSILKDLFSGETSDRRKIEIYVPDKVYTKLSADCSAGSINIECIKSDNVSLDMSAGSIYYNGTDHPLDVFNLSISAGKCTAYDIAANSFDIDMSAGSFEIYDLAGSGRVDLSAGSGILDFGELTGNLDIDLSAGALDVYLPNNADARIKASKSAGSVNVYNNGECRYLNDNDSCTLGSGTHNINVDISAGSVTFYNDSDTDYGITDYGITHHEDEHHAVTSIMPPVNQIDQVIEEVVVESVPGELSAAYEES